jgi:hypothetical protein
MYYGTFLYSVEFLKKTSRKKVKACFNGKNKFKIENFFENLTNVCVENIFEVLKKNPVLLTPSMDEWKYQFFQY